VCVSLIVDGVVRLGVIGCPNLELRGGVVNNVPGHSTPGPPPDSEGEGEQKGCIFVAVQDQGTVQLRLSGSDPERVHIPPFSFSSLSPYSTTPLTFLESVEAAHSSHSLTARIAEVLVYSGVYTPIRMDSQAKYGCLARGQGMAYLRMPTGVGYKEKIWDHAPGTLIVQEAGGIVTDSRGYPLDFSLGRTLGENFGVVAASKSFHPRLLRAVQEAQPRVA